MPRPNAAYAGSALLAATLAVGLTACAGDQPPPASGTSPASTTTSTVGPGSSGSPSPGVTSTPEAADALLDWLPVPGSTDAAVTEAGEWTLAVDPRGTRAVLDGPRPVTLPAGAGRRIAEAFLDDGHALVVAQDRRETRPSVATVVDLASGERTTLDGDSPAPTTSGGTWALGPDQAFYATVGAPGQARAYCLAAADLGTGDGGPLWCAAKRQGFTNARVGSDGTLSLMTFDDARPSCRTLVTMAGVTLDGPDPTPYAGPTACAAWEGVTLGSDRVWTEVPDERHIEQAHAYAATTAGELQDLGAATSGSLLACGDAAYFTRDAGGGEPAQVLRWSADEGLRVVYRAPSAKDGFVVAPLRCGGTRLTLTALTPAGDEQVTAGLR